MKRLYLVEGLNIEITNGRPNVVVNYDDPVSLTRNGITVIGEKWDVERITEVNTEDLKKWKHE